MAQPASGDLFGVAADGTPIRAFDLRSGAVSARVIEWGAALQDLRFAGEDRPLVLGFPTLADYEADTEHVGAVVGRCANRLGGGRFEIDGAAGRATRNVGGETTLHGGARGYGRRPWKADAWGPDFVALALEDPDGEEGFPGAVSARCAARRRVLL